MKSQGEFMDEKLLKGMDIRWSFNRGQLTMTGRAQGFGGPGSDKLTFVINPKARPQSIDIRHSNDQSPFALRGIFEFKAKRLRICFNNDRPLSFGAESESGDVLYELEREKE